MIKICLLIPSLGMGGMERVMTEIANYLSSKKKIEVHLLLYGKNRDVFYNLESSVEIHRPEFVFNNKYRIINTFRTAIFLRKKIKEIKPDSVLSFGTLWNIFVVLSLFGTKYPVYVSPRSRPSKPRGLLKKGLWLFTYSNATGLIVQTEYAANFYKERTFQKNIKTIGNPIREITFNQNDKRENIVLTVGRLINTKHFDKLIEMFLNINRKDWKLVIVGGDAQKQNKFVKLKNIIKENDAESKVELAGECPNVDQFYRKSKIFAFTSSEEGFPNVVGEAQNAELPVVAFDCITGPSDMITNGKNGFLIPLFDYSAFEEKLTYLMENEDTRKTMGYKARESIQKFSKDKICEDIYRFISERKL